MPFPEATGWAGPQGQDFGAGADISQAVELYRQQQMMSGQQPIPEMGGMTTRQYLGMLAGSNPDLAGQFATAIGTDLQTIMGEAQAAGQYTNTPSNSLLGRAFGAVGDVGNFIQENPALMFAAPLGLAAAGGYFGAGGAAAGGGGAAAGGGAGGAATTFPYVSGGAVTGSAIPGITSATTAAGAAAAGLTGGGAAAAGALGNAAGGAPNVNPGVTVPNGLGNALGNVPDWVGNYLLPGLNTLLGHNAADQASDAMVGAADRALAENQRQFDTTRSDLMPWMDAGKNALGRMQDPNAFAASPDYGFRRDEGMRGIENSFASRGMGQSGNALKALTEFNSGLASGEYNDWWNRQAGVAGVGQNTAVNLGGIGASAANARGNYLTNAGDARASGVLGKNTALAGGLNDAFYNHLYRRRSA